MDECSYGWKQEVVVLYRGFMDYLSMDGAGCERAHVGQRKTLQ